MTFVVAVLVFIFACVVLMYPYQFVRMVGHLDWAEKIFDQGGTYTAWRLLGIILIIVSFLILRYGLSLGL